MIHHFNIVIMLILLSLTRYHALVAANVSQRADIIRSASSMLNCNDVGTSGLVISSLG